MNNQLQDQLFRCMFESKKDIALELIDSYAKKYGYESAVVDFLEPALQRFGEIWASQENVSLAQGYITAKIAEETLTKLAGSKIDKKEVKGVVVMGNIEDDYHALGRKLVCTFLRSNGWHAIDLGNDVLAKDFVEKALEVKARVIGISAMMYTTAINIKKVRKEIDHRGLTGKIKMAVGGAVFILRPELVYEVGGDGTSRNALSAPALFQNLWDKADPVEGT